jgi:hypothetical protein
MKMRKVLMLLLLALFVTGNGFTAIGATINPEDYWVLEDGYNMKFSLGKTLTVTETSGENRYNVNFMDTGTWTLGYDASGNLLMYGATMFGGGVFDVVNPQDAALFPSEMVVGDAHTIVFQRNEYSTSGEYNGQGRSSVVVTVSGPETITVPAGTFATYRFQYADTWSDSWGNSGISNSTFWLAEGIGWVKVMRSSVTYELQKQGDEGSPPSAPQLSVSTSDVTLSLSWTAQANGEGYTLFYAPYPYTGPETIGTIDMGAETGGSFSLWEGAAFYLAVEAYNSFGNSGLSNIEYFIMGYPLSVSPSSLSLSPGQTGTCTISGGTGSYSATSSNTAVATVSVSGGTLNVAGVSEGSATVTVRDSGGDSGTVSVTVVPDVTTLNSSDYFITSLGYGIRYRITDTYNGLDDYAWVDVTCLEQSEEGKFVFSMDLPYPSGVSSHVFNLVGNQKYQYEGVAYTSMWGGCPVGNQSHFFWRFSLPNSFEIGDEWNTYFGKYSVEDLGSVTHNGIIFENCIKVNIDTTQVAAEWWTKGTGYYIVAKGVGVIEIVFTRMYDGVVTFSYQQHHTLSDQKTSNCEDVCN